ncbi:hypothetical protein [uncultured Actinomyces sp.]|uniref:hypothetical protein n=1 Tax=uncultured Actinomyces sp. TaxID=249061 RepID=UPI00267326FB|nr:hypothetical protein [uncultured Actinomyces sp.]
MNTQDPLAGLDGVRTYQERVMVRAVRLTRDNADAIAKIARKTVACTDYGAIYLTGPGDAVLAIEGDMIGVAPGRMRVSNRTATDFRAWYTHPGQPITEEDLA